MGFFKKLGRSTGRLFKKASHGVSHTFKKAGKGITRGVSIAGRKLGKEGGGIAYDALSKQRRNKVNSLVNQVTRQSIPDSKYFRGPVRVGQNGGGIRQKNPLEKSKVKRNEMGNIV